MFSPDFSRPPQRLGDLRLRWQGHMEEVSVATLSFSVWDCPGCGQSMCDFYSFQRPHECNIELRCEPAYRMTACGHVYGEECLLRKLERYGECPLCRRARIARERGEVGRERSVDTFMRERELVAARRERDIADVLEAYVEGSVEPHETMRGRESDGRVSRATFRHDADAEQEESVDASDAERERVSDGRESGAAEGQELFGRESEEREDTDDEGSMDSFEAERERVSDGRISRLAFRRGE